MSKPEKQKYIVCYLDILGYKELMEIALIKEGTIRIIKDLLNASIFGLANDFRSIDMLDIRMPLEKLKISLISDTLLIRMPLEKLKRIPDSFNTKNNTGIYIEIFLIYIMNLFLFFPALLSYFIRGGITINQHYEDELNGCGLFVMSKALIEAYKLENENPKYIRILISDTFLKYTKKLDKSNFTNLEKLFFYDDIIGRNCLNVYFPFTKNFYPDVIMRNKYANLILGRIKNTICSNIKRFQNNTHIVDKYHNYIKYHNWQVKEVLKRPEFEIII